MASRVVHGRNKMTSTLTCFLCKRERTFLAELRCHPPGGERYLLACFDCFKDHAQHNGGVNEDAEKNAK